MAYDQTVIDDFNRALRDRGVTSTKVRKSLFEAGIVESGLRNLDYGDRDSLGPLQQRPSQGWRNARDPYKGALDFLDQAIPLAGKYKTSGELAQGVQRSAFPGRYNDVSSQAASLLGGLTGGGQAQPVASSGSSGSSQAPQLLDAGQGSDFTSLLGSLLAKPQPAQASPSPIQAPSFAAGPKLPQGAQLLSPTQAPQPQDAGGGLSDALSLVAALGGTNPTVGSSGGSQTADGVSGGQQRQQQPAAPGSASPAGSGRFPTGVTGKVIGTPYSGTHTLGNWQSDNAVDIAVPEGTPMIALQDGVVLKVRHHPQDGGRFAGDQITIRGANGNEYFYAHGVADVKPGQKITKGESLGATGSANGVAHLHFGQMRGDPRKHTR